jgi:AhpD family alkylhydroperoxidase
MFLLKEINELFDNFSKAVGAPNNLDAKTKALIALATAVSVDCVPCTKSYYKKAIDSGATKDEISEALAITMVVAAGSRRAKYAPVIEELEKSR